MPVSCWLSVAALCSQGVPAMLLEPHDGDVTIPIAHSSLGYAFLSNLPSTGSVEYNRSGSFWRHDAVLQMDMWIRWAPESGGRIGFPPPRKNELVLSIGTGCA